jgi:hypothetical protein
MCKELFLRYFQELIPGILEVAFYQTSLKTGPMGFFDIETC